jgi:CBS domain containing-hemolysin-like protein
MDPAAGDPTGLRLFALIGLVVANAFFVAAEFGLVGARKTRLEEMAKGGDRSAALARRMIGSLDRYISATAGITLGPAPADRAGTGRLIEWADGVLPLRCSASASRPSTIIASR